MPLPPAVTVHNAPTKPVETFVADKVDGSMPSAKQAVAQRLAQIELDTTVTSLGEGTSKLPIQHYLDEHQKKSQAKKDEAKAKDKKEAPEGGGGPDEARSQKAKEANAQLQRQRARDQELKDTKARLAELEVVLPQTREYERMFKDARKDPVGFMKKAGFVDKAGELDLDALVQATLNHGRRPEADVKLEELERKIADKEAAEASAREQHFKAQAIRQANENLGAHFADIAGLVSADPDRYEFTALKMATERQELKIDNGSTFQVEEAIADAYGLLEHAFNEKGIVLSPKQIADMLEKQYEREYKALKGSKKIRQLLTAKDDAPRIAPKKEASPTLGAGKLTKNSPARPHARPGMPTLAELLEARGLR